MNVRGYIPVPTVVSILTASPVLFVQGGLSYSDNNDERGAVPVYDLTTKQNYDTIAEGYTPVPTAIELPYIGNGQPHTVVYNNISYTWPLSEKYFLTNDIVFASIGNLNGKFISISSSPMPFGETADSVLMFITITAPGFFSMLFCAKHLTIPFIDRTETNR